MCTGFGALAAIPPRAASHCVPGHLFTFSCQAWFTVPFAGLAVLGLAVFPFALGVANGFGLLLLLT